MLTTVLQENMSMELKMPENTGEPIPIPHSRTITLIADANNQLYYYNGEDMQNLSKQLLQCRIASIVIRTYSAAKCS
ncbi:MAG: hypothetical protein IPI65_13800 [Bacteroidetes bacterium]|nr:hypothetical protein [Bacteroidota bacterium]